MSALPANPVAAVAKLKLPDGFNPSWDALSVLPAQGEWTGAEYLRFTDGLEADRRVELVDGRIEVLPVPTEAHQLINGFLYRVLFAFVQAAGLGVVVFAGLRVRTRASNFRQPDVVFLSRENVNRRGNRFWTGADLAMEIVSEDDPDRDHVEKRDEYARAGIREYWVVDPRDRSVTLYVLEGSAYREHGRFHDGQRVASVVLPGFEVAVAEVFDAARG